jgi:hypothetical protein
MGWRGRWSVERRCDDAGWAGQVFDEYRAHLVNEERLCHGRILIRIVKYYYKIIKEINNPPNMYINPLIYIIHTGPGLQHQVEQHRCSSNKPTPFRRTRTLRVDDVKTVLVRAVPSCKQR